MISDRIIPISINKIDIANVCFLVNEWFNNIRLSGIRSVMDIVSITPDAKARLIGIILFSFIGINIRIVPNRVDNPAVMVNKNDRVIVFIISPLKYMFLYCFYFEIMYNII